MRHQQRVGGADGADPALLLGLAKHIVPESVGLQNNGPWQRDLGVTLQGKTLGLLGLGKIGGQMARVAQAFGMRVLASSQNLTAERAAQEGFCWRRPNGRCSSRAILSLSIWC